jgi:hypothetical protein
MTAHVRDRTVHRQGERNANGAEQPGRIDGRQSLLNGQSRR